ncbi:MAG: hypothetical protein JST82_14805 [Bacteroidetes bacterium]|nr:hypothetical protein [Bacteroidota bacterium]
MKLRLGALLVVAFFMITSMSSCVHDYICQCTIKYTGTPGLPDSVTHEYNISDTKKKAKSTCQGNSKKFDKDGIHAEENCDLY